MPTVQSPSAYGVNETNGLDVIGYDYHGRVDYSDEMTLSQIASLGGKISRVRFLTEYWPQYRTRMYDLSYCHATLPDGRSVPVNVTHYLMGIAERAVKSELIAWAKAEGVFAKGLGLLDENNWSVLK